jgi:hypothetical protein
MKKIAGGILIAVFLTWSGPARAQYVDSYSSAFHKQLERLSRLAAGIGTISLMVFADAVASDPDAELRSSMYNLMQMLSASTLQQMTRVLRLRRGLQDLYSKKKLARAAGRKRPTKKLLKEQLLEAIHSVKFHYSVIIKSTPALLREGEMKANVKSYRAQVTERIAELDELIEETKKLR